MKKYIPLSLIIFRLLLGPAMIWLTYIFKNTFRIELTILLLLGFLSDIFDGIIARKIGVSSEKLRRMDSQTDLVFWLCIGYCSFLLQPQIFAKNYIALLFIFFMEALTYIYSISKFGKETCTHALLSKLWGLSLFVAFVAIIGFGYGGITFFISLVLGLIGHIDVLLIIYFLPKWTHDVPSCYHAYLIKKGVEIKRNKWFNG